MLHGMGIHFYLPKNTFQLLCYSPEAEKIRVRQVGLEVLDIWGNGLGMCTSQVPAWGSHQQNKRR